MYDGFGEDLSIVHGRCMFGFTLSVDKQTHVSTHTVELGLYVCAIYFAWVCGFPHI